MSGVHFLGRGRVPGSLNAVRRDRRQEAEVHRRKPREHQRIFFHHILRFFPEIFANIWGFDNFFEGFVLCWWQAGRAQADHRSRGVILCALTAFLQNLSRQLPRRRVRRQIRQVLDPLSIHTVAE